MKVPNHLLTHPRSHQIDDYVESGDWRNKWKYYKDMLGKWVYIQVEDGVSFVQSTIFPCPVVCMETHDALQRITGGI